MNTYSKPNLESTGRTSAVTLKHSATTGVFEVLFDCDASADSLITNSFNNGCSV